VSASQLLSFSSLREENETLEISTMLPLEAEAAGSPDLLECLCLFST
jgi:hypothetical protein